MQTSLLAAMLWLGFAAAKKCSESNKLPYSSLFTSTYEDKTTTSTSRITLTKTHTEPPYKINTSSKAPTSTSVTTLSPTSGFGTSTTLSTVPFFSYDPTPTPTNLVQNPGFENGGGSLPPWVAVATPNGTVGSNDAFSGLTQPGNGSPNAVRLNITLIDSGQQAPFASISQAVPISPNITYMIAYDLALTLAQSDGNGNYGCLFSSSLGGTLFQQFFISSVSGYTTYMSTIVPSTTDPLLVQLRCFYASAAQVELDNFYVAEA
ncbi:hypothetical protein JX266_011901 [Neoarthrinium moseri]|nr:hypothetical protein JX266_011901 [Neoarthrinium moseri]